MEWHQRSLRAGTWAILLAIFLRLYSSGAFIWLGELLRQPETAAVLLYFETGKVFRPPPETTVPPTDPTTEPTLPAELPVFTAGDEELVTVRNIAGVSVDVGALLETPLQWDLTLETPSVLLLHTHATESYTQTADESYVPSGDYRTLDTGYNLVSIGNRLEDLLTDGGIGVIHGEELHDYPSYDGGYERSRATVREVLDRDAGVQLVLDLHRDAAVDEQGNQFATSCMVNNQESAQMMLVVGAGHPNWQENMALAVKLTALLEKMHPGITRGIILHTYDYNQDLSPGALLVEVGAAGDTRQKALVAVEVLAEAILVLANGSK